MKNKMKIREGCAEEEVGGVKQKQVRDRKAEKKN
jgi:hypothetical protein